jgi:hypothetical protein
LRALIIPPRRLITAESGKTRLLICTLESPFAMHWAQPA